MLQLRLRDTYDDREKRGIIDILERRSIVCSARIGMISYHRIEEKEFFDSALTGVAATNSTENDSLSIRAPMNLRLKVVSGTSHGIGTIIVLNNKESNKQAILGFIFYDDESKKQFFVDALTKNGQLGSVEEL